MYYINICNQADRALFYKALNKLKTIKKFKMADEILEDVDGSLYAILTYEGYKVVLKNDEDICALFIESDRNLEDVIYN